MNKIKVVISGLIFPFTMLHFFWRAFERRSDVELFVLGPFTDDLIPWNNGIRLPRKYVKQPNYALPAQASQMKLPSSFVEREIPWKPDLWLQIDAGWHFTNRPNAGIVGHVQTDPHVLKGHYKFPKAYSDKVWTMQTPYKLDDEIYLPYGYDPEIHFPEKREKIYDACLIGLHYETRNRLVSRLRSIGLKVYYSIGEVYDDYREKYNQSKIALSWSSMQDLPARNWEALAMELPLVCNRVPDMTQLFEEERHYLGFDSLVEAEKQVMRLLVDDKLLAKISNAGYWKVRGNSWDDRVEQILKDCKLV